MDRISRLTDERLSSLYDADGFGGEKTMRAKVIRELIDEIRTLRRELASRSAGEMSAPMSSNPHDAFRAEPG